MTPTKTPVGYLGRLGSRAYLADVGWDPNHSHKVDQESSILSVGTSRGTRMIGFWVRCPLCRGKSYRCSRCRSGRINQEMYPDVLPNVPSWEAAVAADREADDLAVGCLVCQEVGCEDCDWKGYLIEEEYRKHFDFPSWDDTLSSLPLRGESGFRHEFKPESEIHLVKGEIKELPTLGEILHGSEPSTVLEDATEEIRESSGEIKNRPEPPTRCFVCEREMKSACDPEAPIESTSAISDGGTIELDLGYGSRYDGLRALGVICDDCVEQRQRLLQIKNRW